MPVQFDDPIVWDPQIFSYYTFTHLENFICLAWVVKNFEGRVWGGLPIVGFEISHILFTILILSFFHIYLFWRFYVSSLNGRSLSFEGSPLWCPKFCQIWPFLHICLSILKLWCIYLTRLKSLNFGVLVWGGLSIVVPLKICQIIYFQYIYLFWKFHQSSVNG